LAIGVNSGIIIGSTVTFNVVTPAHWPTEGVKVYTVVPDVAVFISAGFHFPEIPLLEVPDRAGGVLF
jgi:hypothetical protein